MSQLLTIAKTLMLSVLLHFVGHFFSLKIEGLGKMYINKVFSSMGQLHIFDNFIFNVVVDIIIIIIIHMGNANFFLSPAFSGQTYVNKTAQG